MPPQLPIPGDDWQVWGGELISFLQVALANPNGTLLAPVLLQGSHASAPNGRQIAGGSGIAVADAGPGSTLSLGVNVDNSTVELFGSAVRIKDGGVISQKLADGSVVLAKIGAGAVTDAKITGPISMAKIGWSGSSSQVVRGDGSVGTPTVQIPTGMCLPYAANSAPPGSDFLPCDGAAVSRTTYASLFGVIGTTHGAGDGTTTFNVPDMRGRVAVGKGVHADVDNVGDSDGASASIRRPKHQHTVYDPGHVHKMAPATSVSSGSASDIMNDTGNTGANTGSAVTGVKVNPEGGAVSTSPVDAPSYLTLLWCIKT